jgi:hypothetical protein
VAPPHRLGSCHEDSLRVLDAQSRVGEVTRQVEEALRRAPSAVATEAGVTVAGLLGSREKLWKL